MSDTLDTEDWLMVSIRSNILASGSIIPSIRLKITIEIPTSPNRNVFQYMFGVDRLFYLYLEFSNT